MQLDGELVMANNHSAARKYPGFISGASIIIRNEGIKGLYKGLSASLCREGSYSSIRLGLYDPMKEFLGSITGSSTTTTNASSLGNKILAGACTGALGSALANPTDLIKIRMQGDVKGTRYNSLRNAALSIWAKEGLKGLYTGVGATTQRAILLTATQIPSYDHSKHLLLKQNMFEEGVLLHMICSMFAGFMTATVTSPVDVIKTRIMNQKRSGNNIYKGSFDAGYQILKTEGIQGFYKGWFPNWMRIGPHTIVTLMIFEQLRSVVGMKPV